MLRHYNRYMLKLLVWPMVLIVFCLTGIIWLTQALRFIDFIINRGLSVWDFFNITLLLVPGLLVIILPVSLFVAVIFCYSRLAGDSELIVMEASGLSPLQLAKPAMALALAVTLIGYFNALYMLPMAERRFDDMEDFLKNNYTSVLLQEEVFNHPVEGLTVFIRERGDDGALKGIMVHDARPKGEAVTMMADSGQLTQTSQGPRFLLNHGMRQVMHDGVITWLDFDSYNLDLSFYTKGNGDRAVSEKELFLGDLFNGSADPKMRGRYLAEAHRRLTWPLYSFGLALFAVAVLLGGEFNRRGRWKRLVALATAALAVVLWSFELTTFVSRMPAAFPLMYFAVFSVLGISWAMLWRDGRTMSGWLPPRRLTTGTA